MSADSARRRLERIALVAAGIYPGTLGGLEKHTWFLARYLARRGIHVDLHCHGGREAPDQPPSLVGFTDEEKALVSVHEVPLPHVPRFPGHYLWRCRKYSKRLLASLRKQEPVDYIYAQGMTGWCLGEARKEDPSLPPVGVNLHGLEMFQLAPDFRSRLGQLLMSPGASQVLRGADQAFSLGGHLNQIHLDVGVAPSRLCPMPIAVEEEWLSHGPPRSADRRSFVFVGRFERRKGVQELQHVLETLPPDFDFHFVGPIPESVQLKRPHLHYWGLVTDAAVLRERLRACDVFVCPSFSEGMPTVILEAMASGLAIIATDVGAVPDIVSDEVGWLIPPADALALREAMSSALGLPVSELDQRKTAARELVKRSHLWSGLIDRTITAIESVL